MAERVPDVTEGDAGDDGGPPRRDEHREKDMHGDANGTAG